MKLLISPVDGKKINIEGMSRKQLRDLHYQEEVRIAKMIRSYPPFSEERKKIMNEGYAFIESLMSEYIEKSITGSFGASNASVQLVCSILTNMRDSTEQKKLVYEAGVGSGYAAKAITNLPNVQFCGCDVKLTSFMMDLMKERNNIRVNEDTLYNDLMGMPDNSIDLFYADNVIEHLVPDEAPAIFALLRKKVKRGGILVMIIPNRYSGPHDVTRYYWSQGQTGTGFHFMELTYREGISLGLRNGFWPSYIAKKDASTYRLEKDLLFIKNAIRILKEWLYSKVDNQSVRRELLQSDEFWTYVLERK